MSKIKIAVLIDWYLPGTKAGGPVRSVYSLVNLLKDEFDFYIITTDTDLGANAPYPDISADTLIEKDGVHYYYFSRRKLYRQNMLTLLNTIDPALIYLNSFWSWHFSIEIVRMRHKGLLTKPVLLAPRGMLGRGALGLKSWKKRFFLTLAKRFNWYGSIFFQATQQQEERDIAAEFRQAKILITPNINSSPAVENKSVKQSGHLNLFFLSRISEVKNLHFALELLKDVPASCSIDYQIFGNIENVDYWERCKGIIAQLPTHVTVEYKGELPFHQVQKNLSLCQALLMPTLNENYGHSIVESLLTGCPVIISDQTPWTDVADADAGYSLSLSDRKGFVDAICTLASLDQAAFSEKSKSANLYISQKINLGQARSQYKQLFHDTIKN